MPGLKILITSGATREAIDEVRFISNISTGRTGAKLADFFQEAGFDVTYLCGEGSAEPFHCASILRYQDFVSLDESLKKELGKRSYFAVIHLAAVSDYSVKEVLVGNGTFKPSELKKIDSGEELGLVLKKNYKIVDRLKSYSTGNPPIVIAFKLTNTSDSLAQKQAIEKLQSREVDVVVHNDLRQIKNEKGVHRFQLSTGSSCVGVEELGVKIVEIFGRSL